MSFSLSRRIKLVTELLVAGVLPDVIKTIFGSEFLSEILLFVWRICPKPRLELTSHLSNAYKVTRSDLGDSLLRTIRPSLWNLWFFVHPSHVTICNSKYIFLIYSFLSIVICLYQPFVDKELSKSNRFQTLIQPAVRLCTVVIIFIIRWHLPYGMSIVTKIIFIYNNRLTL